MEGQDKEEGAAALSKEIMNTIEEEDEDNTLEKLEKGVLDKVDKK